MFFAGFACVALVSLAQARVAMGPPEVRVDGGIVRGAIEHGVIAFKGIPYAAPPVGALRWAPPQPVTAWRGVRPALHFGPDCAQLPTPGDDAPLRTTPREDCLYLNVWRPKARSSRGLPVMVWVYGGGFVDGGTSPAVYDGTEFARDGVVLVSFNYRLGNFGFFAFPTLDGRAAAGLRADYTIMDQIAALQWVQRNAASFGGDPHNVTIFGESAGGMSVNALLIAPLARGLFDKAIIESGAGRDNGYPLRFLSGSPDSAESIGLNLARHLGIDGERAGAMAELRALPAARLVDGLNLNTMDDDHTYVGGPIVDSGLYPGAPVKIYEAGGGARVPVLLGANTDEISHWTPVSLAALWRSFGADAAAARRIYDADGRRTLQEVALAAGADQWMVEPARAIARSLSARGQRVYEYRFGYIATALRGSLSGAPHSSEIPFVFDTLAAHYGRRTSEADEAMARALHAYWIAFARTGRPDPRGEPAWPEYHASTDRIMSFTDRGPVFETDPWKHRLDIAERLALRTGHLTGRLAPPGLGRRARPSCRGLEMKRILLETRAQESGAGVARAAQHGAMRDPHGAHGCAEEGAMEQANQCAQRGGPACAQLEDQLRFVPDVRELVGDQRAAEDLEALTPGDRFERAVIDVADQLRRDENVEVELEAREPAHAAENGVGPVAALRSNAVLVHELAQQKRVALLLADEELGDPRQQLVAVRQREAVGCAQKPRAVGLLAQLERRDGAGDELALLGPQTAHRAAPGAARLLRVVLEMIQPHPQIREHW